MGFPENVPAREARLDEVQCGLLRRYAELLSACVSVRLTGTRGAEELYALHILDCLESAPLLPGVGPVIDVGSGGGLPGIVWAVCRPDLHVVLLDSVGKKVRAAQEIVEALGLTNVEAVCARSEDFAKERREAFSLACARAVASAGVTAELLSPLVRVGGTLLTFKGPKAAGELDEVRGRWGRLGLKAPEVRPCSRGEDGRCFVLWEKAAPCPRAYPRRAGMAAMKGWWL